MKTTTPSRHYSIRLPDDVTQQWDEQVLSLWRDDDPTVLQLSSYLRESERQVSAKERLSDRRAGSSTKWSPLDIGRDWYCDIAAASTADGDYIWWHIYLVEPNVAVYATISFPTSMKASEWAIDAVRSIRFGSPVDVPV
jgi:hypothetical protein